MVDGTRITMHNRSSCFQTTELCENNFLCFLHIKWFWCFSPNSFDNLEGTMPRWEWVEGWFNLSSGSLRSVSGSEKKRWAFNIVAILIFYAIVWINPIFYFLFFVHSNLLLETIIPPVEKKLWWKLVVEDMFHWYRHHGPSKQSLCMRTVFGHHSLSPILPFQGPKGMYLYHLCSKFKSSDFKP
jgi:hypothetical protein